MVIKILNKVAGSLGYELKKKSDGITPDIRSDRQFMHLYDQCRAYTMTSPERLFSLYQAVNYVIDNNIPGDFIECGVWKGGSSMMMALTLLNRGVKDRSIYMYDTYEGMSEPTDMDKSFTGADASELLSKENISDPASIWCYSSLEEVKKNISQTSYPADKIIFVKGKVEDTLASNKPVKVAILRLDTDWYESTKKELEELYPLLAERGVLIIDDFGHWEGAKKAVLEYFEASKPLLHRIDNTGRILIK